MNKLVDSWNKHQSRPEYVGLDSIKIDDTKITLPTENKDISKELIKMAVRKKIQTAPVLDNSAINRKLGGNPKLNKSKLVTYLPKNHFDNTIYHVKTGEIEKVLGLRNATYRTLRRLKIKRNLDKAVKYSKNYVY